ncbi:PepSY domain-containing protein [Streptomyces peucetius]|uniref:PepSY domain-containing protein n=1 Tax=Streptomyces peucetius TaxID=1950 RepID=A0ABY6IBR0_STRPE|nr:PepSY domain-containing protein [Streptomyces peucetius]UYQ64439.1 PepSY domain-containing protein [Streptomyces peucetius]
MKRNLVIATVAAAVLVGGGTYTAAALASDDAPASTASRSAQDRNDDRAAERPAGSITATEAVTAALKHTPGAVDSVDLDDDGAAHWEVEVVGKDDREHELKVDAKSGALREDDDDDRDDDGDRDDDDRAALRAASVDAREAARAALKAHPGATVTSVDFDDDAAAHWEVELGDGKEVSVDAKSATVTNDRADD